MSAAMPIRSSTPIRKSVARSATSLALALALVSFWFTATLLSKSTTALAAPLTAPLAATVRAALAALAPRRRRPGVVTIVVVIVRRVGDLDRHPLGLTDRGRHLRRLDRRRRRRLLGRHRGARRGQ